MLSNKLCCCIDVGCKIIFSININTSTPLTVDLDKDTGDYLKSFWLYVIWVLCKIKPSKKTVYKGESLPDFL